ncbi:unnamed protein product [Mytilus coruscus]|uniref:EGF-like domain-containing protein n=1 Tax=Mytilus coruscus TaxID=42192 RepID=A0A6J8BCC6_MYTCO|nr:unnamed protein product [Mytilus coruscus]
MSNKVSLCIKLILSLMLYEPCEAAVGNVSCTASISSSCELYGNAVCACYQKLDSGETCSRVNDATECVSNAVCKIVSSGLKCTCDTGYYDDNFGDPGGQCKVEIALGAICTVSGFADECVPFSTCMSVGSDLKCQCSIGYYDNDVNTAAGTCVLELQSGVTCTRVNDATECVPNSICKDTGFGLKCYCNTGFYDNNFAASGGQCVAEIALSVTCTQVYIQTECVPNAVCQSEGLELKCTCSNGYYDSNFADSGGTCKTELESGVTCTRENDATECVPNSICKDTGSGLKCYCNTGYYDHNFAASGGQCVAEREFGVTCTQNNQPKECVTNAVCKNGGSGLKCYCNTGFYDNNFAASGGQCIPEKESGVTCTQNNQPTECVPNAVCKSGVCICNTGYYDDNFSTIGGQCVSDHSPLYFELDFTNNRPSHNIPKFHTYIKWDNNKNIDYVQLLHNQQDRLLSLVNDISTLDDASDSVREITQILYNSAFEVFGRSVLINKNENNIRKNNEWFDEKCAKERENFHKFRNIFLRHPTDINGQFYITARNSFNKAKRQARTRFKRWKGIELCITAKTDPRKFWSTIKPKNKSHCEVDNDVLFNHFETILGDIPPDICYEVLDLLNNIQISEFHVDFLDSEITDNEVIKAIHKLKNYCS